MGLWRGKLSAGVSALWGEQLATDLSKTLPAVQVPVYLLHGRYDYTVSYPLAKAYYEQLRAPIKGFYTFEQSAHSPMFEEPVRTVRILRHDVLAGTARLADPPLDAAKGASRPCDEVVRAVLLEPPTQSIVQ